MGEIISRNPARARLLNVDVPGMLAMACEEHGAWLLCVSSASVFDGRHPPYTVDDIPCPRDDLGWQKLHAEKLVLATSKRAAVLRVPMLYGPLE